MKELGMIMVGLFAFGIFFSTMIYPNLEYTGYQSAHTCTGECYEEYVRVHGTTVEILQAKQLADAGDPFSSIRGLWAGCAACHGQEGQDLPAARDWRSHDDNKDRSRKGRASDCRFADGADD